MTNNFGFMAQAQRKIEAMQAEAAKVAEASKCLQSIRKDLGINKSDYIAFMDAPATDEQYRNIVERQFDDLQRCCHYSEFLQELGLQQYINKELSDVYQSGLLLEAGNPDLKPMHCMSYIEALTSPETIEHIGSFGKPLCDGMYRSLIIMGLELEFRNANNLSKDYKAGEFCNYMETKVVEQEKLIPCSEF